MVKPRSFSDELNTLRCCLKISSRFKTVLSGTDGWTLSMSCCMNGGKSSELRDVGAVFNDVSLIPLFSAP